MTDVFQQAREALDPKWTRPMQETVSLMHSALLAVVKAADAGHLIDTRRIQALGEQAGVWCDNRITDQPWEVMTLKGGRVDMSVLGRTAGEALAAAEREARL